MNDKKVGCGLSLCAILQIVFIVLKLCNVITWHWALVLLPVIIDASLSLLIVIIYIVAILLREL